MEDRDTVIKQLSDGSEIVAKILSNGSGKLCVRDHNGYTWAVDTPDNLKAEGWEVWKEPIHVSQTEFRKYQIVSKISPESGDIVYGYISQINEHGFIYIRDFKSHEILYTGAHFNLVYHSGWKECIKDGFSDVRSWQLWKDQQDAKNPVFSPGAFVMKWGENNVKVKGIVKLNVNRRVTITTYTGSMLDYGSVYSLQNRGWFRDKQTEQDWNSTAKIYKGEFDAIEGSIAPSETVDDSSAKQPARANWSQLDQIKRAIVWLLEKVVDLVLAGFLVGVGWVLLSLCPVLTWLPLTWLAAFISIFGGVSFIMMGLFRFILVFAGEINT